MTKYAKRHNINYNLWINHEKRVHNKEEWGKPFYNNYNRRRMRERAIFINYRGELSHD